MNRFLLALSLLTLTGCDMFDWSRLLDKVSYLDLKKPELMTSEERSRYVASAFDRASQGKTITINQGTTARLSPGTYQWDNAAGTFPVLQITNPSTLQVWQFGFGGTFSLVTTQTVANVGATAADIARLTYYPGQHNHGAPLIRAGNGDGAPHLVQFPWAGQWSLVETTPAGVPVRNWTGAGAAEFQYAANAAGNIIVLSQTALL